MGCGRQVGAAGDGVGMAQPGETSAHAATASSSMDNNVLAIVIAASVSPKGSRGARAEGRRRLAGPSNHRLSRLSHLLAAVSTSVFIVAILILLLLLYHRDPTCCQFLCSCRLFQTPSQYDHPPHYFSSSQRLVGPQRGASRLDSATENPSMQGDELFYIGPPSTYRLPSGEQPCLPSYESMRKKDRQREIHQMITDRFGLWAEPSQEMPPPYEHALRHPPAFSGTGISSETLDRLGVPDPFHAPLSYQTQQNTAV